MKNPKSSNTNTEPTLSDPLFFSMSLRRFYFLSVVTCNIYVLYWVYKNWEAIKKAEVRNLSPFWRTILTVFYIWPLLKDILRYAKKQGYQQSYAPGVLAALFIVFWLAGVGASYVPDSVLEANPIYNVLYFIAAIVFILLPPLPLLPVQKALNYHNNAVADEAVLRKKTGDEIFITIVGVVLFIVILLGLASSIFLASDVEISPKAQAEKVRLDDLTAQHEACSDELSAQENTIDTNDQAAVDAYNVEWDACEAIRIEQNASVDTYNALLEE